MEVARSEGEYLTTGTPQHVGGRAIRTRRIKLDRFNESNTPEREAACSAKCRQFGGTGCYVCKLGTIVESKQCVGGTPCTFYTYSVESFTGPLQRFSIKGDILSREAEASVALATELGWPRPG